MTVGELLDILLDPDDLIPRTLPVRIGMLGHDLTWEIEGAHGALAGPNPEIVLEIEDP